MTLRDAQQCPWTAEERALARSSLPLADIAVRLPGRTRGAILQQRKGLPRRPADMSALGRLSGAARRLVTTELKNRFIMAVSAGQPITKTGVVSRTTHLAWRKSDPGFFEWLTNFKQRRSQARIDALAAEREARGELRAQERALKEAAKTRKAVRKPSIEEMLRTCDVYEVARKAIGGIFPSFLREEAISLVVLDLLEGELAPEDARRMAKSYISRARRDVSYVSADAPRGEAGRSLVDTYADQSTTDY